MPDAARCVRNAALALVAICAPFAAAHAQEYEQRAPYAVLRWAADAPEIELDGRSYELLAIDGVETAEIVKFCRATWPDHWQKRFREDLVEVLTRMQHPPGVAVDLRVRDLGTGLIDVRKDVPMTGANRQALRVGANPHRAPAKRVQREHAAQADTRYADLARPLEGTELRLTREQAHADLDPLEEARRTGFAYRDRLGVDVEAAFDAVNLACGENVPRDAFTRRIRELIALFGDGHSGVLSGDRTAGFAPFLVEDTDAGVVAFQPDRSEFLDEAHPILAGIDGHSLETWTELASRRVARGAPAYVRMRALRELRAMTELRATLGRSGIDAVEVELRSLDGADSVRKKLPLQEKNPVYAAWPRRPSRLLDGDVGYLRILEMTGDERELDELLRTMGKFRKARALVIDVRGNGGGTRDVLIGLAPFLLRAQDAPLVVNVAAPLLGPNQVDLPEGYLADRSAYPATWPRWSDAARAAIEKVARGFEPEWAPARQPIASWHYFLLDRGEAPPEWTFGGEVAVLMDSACFSATDIFLAALDRLPNVTLVGQPSGGGSGRPQAVRLMRSGAMINLSSMVSYRVDGKLFEGRGVQPDVLVLLPAPNDLIGQGDAMLDAALARLR